MEISAILLARSFYFVESQDLNPRGDAFFPEVVEALVKRFSFQKFPQKYEDFDEDKGIVFEMGRLAQKNIERLTIYNHGLALDTRSSTEESEAILKDTLAWATANLHINFNPAMVKRKAYDSHITFFSKVPLLITNPALDSLAKKVSSLVSSNLKLDSYFAPSGFLVTLDPELQKIPVSAFTIERRQNIAFSEDKYFSAAPLPTEVHLELVREFEEKMATA